MKKEGPKNPKKAIIYYYIIALVVLLLLNALVFPRMMQRQVSEVTYNQFIADLDAGKVSAVEENESEGTITYMMKDENGRERLYRTALINDPGRVDRLLHASGPDGAAVQFGGVIPTQASPLMNLLVTVVFPVLLFVLVGQLLMRFMMKKMGGGNAMTFGKSNAKVYVEAQTGKTFADVAGQDEAKEALAEIVDFLHNPSKYNSIGATLPKGALLVGPPGTGKTLLAKAVAGEAHVPFFSISGSEFVEMFVGMGAARVRDLFKQAADKAPCIVFIDEIDTIGKSRDGAAGMGGNDEREQTLNQLLTEMDGFDGSKGVIILAATNRPETLDKALLRPGRFDRRIPVELPDLEGRAAILKVHAKKVMMDENVDFMAIARATSGASGAELANMINEAALLAVKQNRRIVRQEDLMEAVETVIAGYQRKNKVLSQREKRIVAYHEIGHALVAARQSDSAPVTKITIVPRTSGALGYTLQVPEEETNLLSREEAFNKIATFTGGRAAEELIFGSYTSGASNDIEQATRLARSMVTRLGMSAEFDMMALETVSGPYLSGDAALACSEGTAEKIDREVLAIIRSAHEKAAGILAENKEKLHELANFLMERETITGEEFMEILHRE
ncbi:cell division protein FtsH [Oscillospiraceae bacterium]|nr:cell division protein FtsH [Oscillospiraceae bacterium]